MLYEVITDRHARIPGHPGRLDGCRNVMPVQKHGTRPPDLATGDVLGADPDPGVSLPQDRAFTGIFLDEDDGEP